MKETKAKTETKTDDDVEMVNSQPSRPGHSGNGGQMRPTPQPKTTVEGERKERKEAEDEREANEEERAERERDKENQIPLWATRLVPGCVIHCFNVAENEDAVDSTARIIDNLILTHMKDRIFYLYMANAPAQTYVEHVKNNGMIPEYNGYIPYVGEKAHGDFREPTGGRIQGDLREDQQKWEIRQP